jgi:hypothetical protein
MIGEIGTIVQCSHRSKIENNYLDHTETETCGICGQQIRYYRDGSGSPSEVVRLGRIGIDVVEPNDRFHLAISGKEHKILNLARLHADQEKDFLDEVQAGVIADSLKNAPPDAPESKSEGAPAAAPGLDEAPDHKNDSSEITDSDLQYQAQDELQELASIPGSADNEAEGDKEEGTMTLGERPPAPTRPAGRKALKQYFLDNKEAIIEDYGCMTRQAFRVRWGFKTATAFRSVALQLGIDIKKRKNKNQPADPSQDSLQPTESALPGAAPPSDAPPGGADAEKESANYSVSDLMNRIEFMVERMEEAAYRHAINSSLPEFNPLWDKDVQLKWFDIWLAIQHPGHGGGDGGHQN